MLKFFAARRIMRPMSDLASILTTVLRQPDPTVLVSLQEALLAYLPAGNDRSEALVPFTGEGDQL